MKSFHTEILTKKQEELLPLIKDFSKSFYLVGGTAIALHIGHRYSVDFDLFTSKNVIPGVIKNKIHRNKFKIDKYIFQEEGQAHYILNDVKVTFYSFPFEIRSFKKFKDIIRIPDLLTLSAMKVFAISERNKWKDYVDLYFIFRDYFSIRQVLNKTNELFSDYNDRMFFEQLAYFEDIDYSENIEFIEKDPGMKNIKKFLLELALNGFKQ